MAWITPKDWAVDEQLTAAKLNTHLRDNLNALKSPPSAAYVCDESSDYTYSSTSFADVDATNLALTITTTGGDVMVHFHGTFESSGAPTSVFLDVNVDGTREGGDDGIVVAAPASGSPQVISFTRLIAVNAGEHTFKLQWKTGGVAAKLYAGSGTTNRDVHPQFWAREVS